MTKPNTKVTEKNDPSAIQPPEITKQTDDNAAEREIGGFKDSNLLEPTRYGDWEVKGRCSDF